MKKALALGNTIGLVITIAINYLTNSGMLTGNTMKTISDRYANYFTPAGYAFSIWGVIYLGLLAFVVYGWRSLKEKNNKILLHVGWWFLVSCIANSTWVVVWLSDEILISVITMVVLFISLLLINQNITAAHPGYSDIKTTLMVKWPFAIYFGWVSVALIANIAALLTKLNWDGLNLPGQTWTIIMIAIAGLVNAVVVLTKRLHPFALVGIWALVAIAVANKSGSNISSIIWACYAVSAILLIVVVISAFRKQASGR